MNIEYQKDNRPNIVLDNLPYPAWFLDHDGNSLAYNNKPLGDLLFKPDQECYKMFGLDQPCLKEICPFINHEINHCIHHIKDKYVKMFFLQIIDSDPRIAFLRILLEVSPVEKETQKKSYIDTLTGLYNRLYYQEFCLPKIINLSWQGVSSGVMIVDMNHLKKINDTWGHNAGDQAIKRVAHLLKSSIRKEDVVVRFGEKGDEFFVALFDCEIEQMHEIVSKIIKKFDEEGFIDVKDEKTGAETTILITISLGGTITKECHISGVRGAIHKADTNMYAAKELKLFEGSSYLLPGMEYPDMSHKGMIITILQKSSPFLMELAIFFNQVEQHCFAIGKMFIDFLKKIS